MVRKPNKPSPAADQQPGSSTVSGLVAWKFTKSMNMRDLARDDDYLSHLFIEKLGSLGSTPSLLVHRMDPFRRLPKTDTTDILAIVQRLTRARTSASMAIKQAVNELLELPSVLYFIRDYEQSQINAFATHASRYLELFLPTGSIEIAQTSRYSGITGKNELCILAMRPMQPGFLISELKGSMADLTEEEDRELKRAGSRNDGGMRRDFSVIHSKQLKKNHLFLGPARFVNHDCDNNCELFRNGRYITFRAIKPIALGQELTAHYGEGYFGKNNRHCLCETCERRGKGGFSPQVDDDVPSTQDNDDSEVDNDTDSDSTSVVSEDSRKGKEQVNLNERRTRRGVYLVIPEQQDDSDDSDEDGDDEDPQPATKARAESVATTTLTEVSEATTLSSSPKCVIDSEGSGPAPSITRPRRGRPPKAQPAQLNIQSNEESSPKPAATRSQKAREASLAGSASHLPTPPFVGGSASPAQSNSRASTSAVGSTRLSLRPRKSEPAPIPTPPPGPRPRGRPRKHPLPDGSVTVGAGKVEEKFVEKAAARGRPSIASKVAAVVTATAVEKEAPQQEVVPSIPACVTCTNPLPVGDPTLSRKEKVKDGKEDCPRCRRHLLIYGASWPHRTPTPGSRFSSTRENTPAESIHNVNHASMSTFDHKLKAARLAQLKRSRENEQEQEAEAQCARTSKRRKVNTLPSTPQKSGSSPSARAHVPSAKFRERGGDQIKVESADDIPLHEPLDRSASRSGQKRAAEPDGISTASVGRKRGRPGAASDPASAPFETPPFSEDGDDRRDKTFWPTLPTLPPLGDGIKRTGLLNLRPNPMHVSRWRASPLRSVHSSDGTPMLVDDDTDEATSDEHPATPENNDGHGTTPEVVDIGSRSRHPSGSRDVPPTSDDDDGDEDEYEEENTEGAFCKPKKLTVSTLKGFGLISKPSPLTLSKRIWAPAALIADPDCEDLNPSAVSESTTPKRRRRGRSSMVSPRRTEGNSSTIDPAPTSERSVRVFEARVKKSMFDDFDASSGEEDVIVPGPSNSNLYLLQRNPTFGSSASAQHSPLSPGEDRPCNGTLLSPKPDDVPQPKTFDNPNLPTLGPLHSDFLASTPGSMPFPTFVDAGWESDSSV